MMLPMYAEWQAPAAQTRKLGAKPGRPTIILGLVDAVRISAVCSGESKFYIEAVHLSGQKSALYGKRLCELLCVCDPQTAGS